MAPSDAPPDRASVRLTVLILTALAARWLTFGSPVIHVDEPFYLTVAQAMTHGALPYVDIWDRKPVGLFLLYLPAAIWGLPASLYVYQAMAGAAAVGTAWLIARLADRAGWPSGALPAAMFYLLWLDLADGQGGQTPVFYNLLTAGAAMLVLRATGAEAEGERRWRGPTAMLLIGVGMQVKYTIAFEGIGFALWLLLGDWRRRRSAAGPLLYALLLAVAALTPTLAALGAYALLGQLDAFVFANFLSILHRGKDAAQLQANAIADAAAILSPLGFAAAGWRTTSTVPTERHAALFLRVWLAVAVAAFVGFGGWYNHYTLPVMLPGAACAAALFERRRRSLAWAAVPLAVLFAAGQKVLLAERSHRGTAAQFDALAARVGHGPGALFVYSGPVLLYPATGRPMPTRYIFPSHLQFHREAGSIGVDQAQELNRIFDSRPAAVVLSPAIDDENPALRDLVKRRLWQGGYRATPPLPLGRDQVLVFRAPAAD